MNEFSFVGKPHWKFLVLFLGLSISGLRAQQVSLSGYVRESGSGEMLGNVSVAMRSALDSSAADAALTQTNSYGFFSLTAPQGQPVQVSVRFSGFETQNFTWTASADSSVSVRMGISQRIQEVEITANRNTIADKADMSRINIPTQDIKDIPALLGEKDVLKVIQLLPGVQKGGEGQSGLYVRGGGPDQNLLILDEATVYNANHLFGFFSLFNGDALRSVELVKGGFPARYGGRLSSVIEMTMKEGNKEHFNSEAGIGLISARGLVEGPIVKGKSSFMISARRTYLDALIQPLVMAASGGSNLGYYFYDLNAKFNYELSEKDKLYVSGYFGRDKFYFNDKQPDYQLKTNFGWGNQTLTTRWNHQFNGRTFGNASLIYSHYDLGINVLSVEDNQTFDLKYSSTINDIGAKYDIDWRPNNKHMVRYGASTTMHQFDPSAVVLDITVGQTMNFERAVKTIRSYESGLYIEDKWRLGRVNLYPGFRLSHYAVDQTQYLNPEPRVSVAYNIKKDLSFKTSYAIMNQYIHLLSSSGIGLPTDLWVPATTNVKPMRSQQGAAGLAKDFKKGFSLSAEGYYKTMSNVIQYKEGASFIVNDDLFDQNAPADNKAWEKQVTDGRAWSYGGELFLQKQQGQFTGWVGYTLSWTQMQFDEINQGDPFFARYDRRHDISVVGIYRITPDLTFSATWVYGTGNSITMPQGQIFGTNHIPDAYASLWDPLNSWQGRYIDYGKRNDFRMEAYHRLDLGLQYSKEKKKARQTVEIGCYNAYNRFNPFFYYGATEGNVTKLKKVTLFPFIPSISYSYKFR